VCHRHERQMNYQALYKQKFKFLRRSWFFVLFIDIKMQQQTVVAKTVEDRSWIYDIQADLQKTDSGLALK
jgi:hypothetical protein